MTGWGKTLVVAGCMWLWAGASYAATPRVCAGQYSIFKLALRADGTVWSWGTNFYGELGTIPVNENLFLSGTHTPLRVEPLVDIISIACGWGHALALDAHGSVWAWGFNENGELGAGTNQNRIAPVQVKGLTDVIAISAWGHSLAIKRDGTVWVWGNNARGRLGDGTEQSRNQLVAVRGLANIVAVAAGGAFSMALSRDGDVWTWGYNSRGELADGSTTERDAPARIQNLHEIVAIAAGEFRAFALKSDGRVLTWGSNAWGELGTGADSEDLLSPTPIRALRNIAAISVSDHHSLALTKTREIWAWGQNFQGELGDGTTTNRNEPVLTILPIRMLDASAGTVSSVGIASDRSVWVWGENADGRKGSLHSRAAWSLLQLSVSLPLVC